jgi:hypothetical protein
MNAALRVTFVAIMFSIILVSSGFRKKTNATNPNSESKANYMKASA